MKKWHLYYIIDRSPWLILSAAAVFFLTSGFVLYIHRVENSFLVFILGLIMLVSVFYVWWRDVVRESTYQGNHTLIVQRGLKLGFILFLCTEVMFFSGFFLILHIKLIFLLNIMILLIFLYKFYKIHLINKEFIIYLLSIFIFFYIIFIIIFFNQYFYNNFNILTIFKIIFTFILFLIMKLNFLNFKNRFFIIREYLFKFKIIMFIIGFFLVFIRFFDIFENNLSYAMDKENEKVPEQKSVVFFTVVAAVFLFISCVAMYKVIEIVWDIDSARDALGNTILQVLQQDGKWKGCNFPRHEFENLAPAIARWAFNNRKFLKKEEDIEFTYDNVYNTDFARRIIKLFQIGIAQTSDTESEISND